MIRLKDRFDLESMVNDRRQMETTRKKISFVSLNPDMAECTNRIGFVYKIISDNSKSLENSTKNSFILSNCPFVSQS